MPCCTERHGQLRCISMCGRERLKVAWAVCKSYGLASRTAQAAKHTAVAAADLPSEQESHIQASTAHVSDRGLEVFEALIRQKRFICTQCGKCCTGDGEVWVSDAEVANMAKYLNMPVKHFLEQHTRGYSKVEGFRMLKSNLESQTRDCTFLRPDNTCGIHPVRPVQCLTYPWWPELMEEQGWAWEKANVCEGIDHPDAPMTDVTEAARQLKLATIQEYQKRMSYKPSKKQQQAAAAAIDTFSASSSSSDGIFDGGCSSSSGSSNDQKKIVSQCSSDKASDAQGLDISPGTSRSHGYRNDQEAITSQCSSNKAADAQGLDNSPRVSRSSNTAAAAWQQRLRRLQQPTEGGS